LKELDKEDEDDRPVKKVFKKVIRPPRGSQHIEGLLQATAVSPPAPGKSVSVQKTSSASKPMAAYGFDDAPPDAASEKDLVSILLPQGIALTNLTICISFYLASDLRRMCYVFLRAFQVYLDLTL
jgi:hypothetical protein